MTEDEIITQALTILEGRLHKPDVHFTHSKDAKRYLALRYAKQEYESFNVLYLTNQHGLISLKEMFNGTINGATVYPREIVKTALKLNAGAVILAHNHPSGICEPSHDDTRITDRITKALDLIDVKTLDHIVVGGTDTYSFAEHGLL